MNKKVLCKLLEKIESAGINTRHYDEILDDWKCDIFDEIRLNLSTYAPMSIFYNTIKKEYKMQTSFSNQLVTQEWINQLQTIYTAVQEANINL